MLYLLFVLTFLCGILFYGMSPHDKKLDMTVHQAEGMISSFLVQHQAAKDYLYTWLGGNYTGNLQASGYLNADFMGERGAIIPEVCSGNTGQPGVDEGSCFVSKVVCLDAMGTSVNCDLPQAKKHYIITYGGWEACDGSEGCTWKRPDWWPSEGNALRRYESWRRAISKRTRDSFSCGTLVQVGNNWCIDNGQSVLKKETRGKHEDWECRLAVPSAVLTAVDDDQDEWYLRDMLFCMSEFKQGLGNYVSGASYFYDGLANAGFGKHLSKKQNWTNLGSVSGTMHSSADLNMGENFLIPGGRENINIPLDENYTLTVIAAISGEHNEEHGCALFATGSEHVPIFTKNGLVGGTHAFVLNYKVNDITAGTAAASACNMKEEVTETGPEAYSRITANDIISWTFVVTRDTDDSTRQNIDVYENTVKRAFFSGKKITTTYIYSDPLLLHLGCSTARIYGIRYYPWVLQSSEIQKNFKVDQKRFSIPDRHNGADLGACTNESEVSSYDPANEGGA